MAFETLFARYDRLMLFDTETTGLQYNRDEIIEFAAIVVENPDGQPRVVQEYDQLVALSPGSFVPPRIQELTGISTQDLRERGLPVNKIYAQGDPAIFPPLLERAARCREVTVTSSAPYNFEIVPAGVDKGTGLAALAEELGLTLAETIAIGDSDNDRGMLAAAGMPVAMGNATDAIKAMARYVTETNENGGVARAIRHFIP